MVSLHGELRDTYSEFAETLEAQGLMAVTVKGWPSASIPMKATDVSRLPERRDLPVL